MSRLTSSPPATIFVAQFDHEFPFDISTWKIESSCESMKPLPRRVLRMCLLISAPFLRQIKPTLGVVSGASCYRHGTWQQPEVLGHFYYVGYSLANSTTAPSTAGTTYLGSKTTACLPRTCTTVRRKRVRDLLQRGGNFGIQRAVFG